MERPHLNETDTKKLEQLCLLVDYGDSCFSGLDIKWDRIRLRKKTLLKMATAIHSHTMSACLLLDKGQIHSAEALLRLILETVTNAEYIICGRNNEALNRFLCMGNTELIKRMKGMLKIVEQDPSVSGISKDDLLDAIYQLDASNKAFGKKFKYHFKRSNISLEARALRIDQEHKKHGQRNLFSRHWRYLVHYTPLSDNVHLGARGLQDFVFMDSTGVSLLSGGKTERISHTIDSFYVYYVEMLRIMHKQIKFASTERIRTFQKNYKPYIG